MPGATAALIAEEDGVTAATAEWKARRDVIVEEMHGLPLVVPDGGWSLLIDTVALGMKPDFAAERLFRKGAVAATPMIGWGHEERAGRYLRFVFANESVARLEGLRERIHQSWSL
jgi:aspartate/methionine/tyrosine aminotransferase